MRYIVGVDPGKATGIAVFDLEAGAWLGSYKCIGDETYESLQRWALERSALFAVERFVITGASAKVGRGQENWSSELIGLCRFFAWKYNLELVLQGASEAKKFGTDQRLREIGWWNPGHDHANDAARHTLLWLANNRRDILEKLVYKT